MESADLDDAVKAVHSGGHRLARISIHDVISGVCVNDFLLLRGASRKCRSMRLLPLERRDLGGPGEALLNRRIGWSGLAASALGDVHFTPRYRSRRVY